MRVRTLPSGTMLRNQAGEIYIVAQGVVVPVAVLQVSDDQLAGIPVSPLWVIMQDGNTTTWSGNGTKTTEPFTISGSQWRIESTVKSERGVAQLCIAAKRTSDSRLTSNGCAHGGGETYGQAGTTGMMQMEITGVNGGWTVTVEELR